MFNDLLDGVRAVEGQMMHRAPSTPNMVSIEYLGQAVFFNSSVEFTKLDAETVTRVHHSLNQQRILS